jgi:NADPH:quinone reductase
VKAVVATAYGEPEKLSIADLPVPRPGPGQILVKIAAASINPTDLRVVTGGFGDLFELDFPYTLGNDFAGTVVEAGEGVAEYAPGDEVFGQAMPRSLRAVTDPARPSLSTGAMAEYAVFETDTPMLAHRPANVPAEQAAALGIAGLTVLALLEVARVQPGETALVIGATGGVGTTLVPLLAAAGVKVVGTARNEVNAAVLRELGAEQVIGFDQAEYPAGVDVVFNLFLASDSLAAAGAAVRPGGRLISIVYPPPTTRDVGREDVDLHFVMDVAGKLGGMRAVAGSAAKGDLVALIGGRYPLGEGVQAVVDYARASPMGKIVITM